jgi:hypothetical protein
MVSFCELQFQPVPGNDGFQKIPSTLANAGWLVDASNSAQIQKRNILMTPSPRIGSQASIVPAHLLQ